MTATNWYYEQNGVKKGPIPKDELAKFFIDKSIDSNTLIWREGMPNWLKANETGEFSSGDGPPPLPISHISSSFILLVSTLPIWMLFVEFFISVILAGDNSRLVKTYFDHTAWIFVTVILNSIFCFIDSVKIEKSGIEPPAFIWAILLIPVYIYKRGSNLRKVYGGDFVNHQLFFFAWLGSFLISLMIGVPLYIIMAIQKIVP